MKINFEKWQGLGNDFIIVENIKITPEIAKKLCDRNFGIGADGIFCPTKTLDADISWDFYNSDGTIAQMCGNGIRCFAKYVFNKNLVKNKKFSVKTLAGIIVPEISDNGNVRVNMGKPFLKAEEIPVNSSTPQDFTVQGFKAGAVGMGNPHCIIVSNDDTRTLAKTFGSKVELDPIFPEKTNVEFVKILSEKEVQVDVWERGCGITLACGTGACATTVLLHLRGLIEDKIKVNLPGGSLDIEYSGENVYMEGPANLSFVGEIEI